MNKIKQVFSHDSTSSSSNEKTSHGPSLDQAGAAPVVESRTGFDSRNNSSTDLDNTSRSHNNEAVVPSSHNNNESSIAAEGRHLEQHAAPAHNHGHSKEVTPLDETATHDAQHDHLQTAPVEHRTHHKHVTEEVERQTELEKHVHHVQHHVQPVHDTVHEDTQHHQKIHPTTEIHEQHVSDEQDKALYAGLNKHQDKFQHAGEERTIVDKGERVTEHQHHHVHHVIQPVIERDTHEHHTAHTVIPTHHTVHEAPIVHSSVEHASMPLKDFVSGGGNLQTKLTHDKAGVMNDGECVREIDGPLEDLKTKLHIGSGSHHDSTVAPTGTTGTTGTTGGAQY